MLRKEKLNTDYLEDWPKHYYEIENIRERKAILQERINLYHEKDDIRRMELLNRRFDLTGDKPVDRFMRGWLFFQMYGNKNSLLLGKKKNIEHMKEEAHTLCVSSETPDALLEEEWKDFSFRYIATCCDSTTYRSLAFGLIPMKDKAIALKLAKEIDQTTRVMAEKANLLDAFKPLRAILIQVYIDALENGASYWEDYTQSI